MYARVTPYKMKPGSREAATAVMNTLKEDILSVGNMHHFINVMNDDGQGYIVALTDEAEMSEEVAIRVKQIWGRFAEFLEAEPAPTTFDVIANWK